MATINKAFINSLPELYNKMGENRFFLMMEKNADINNFADMVLARTNVLPAYRKEYKDEYNHLLALNKALKQYSSQANTTFWTYMTMVLNCSVIDFARKKATSYKKYLVTDELPSAKDTIDDFDIEQHMTNVEVEKAIWDNVNSRVGNLFTEIVKLKAAGYNDRDIRKRLKIKQSDIEDAKAELLRVYEVEI